MAAALAVGRAQALPAPLPWVRLVPRPARSSEGVCVEIGLWGGYVKESMPELAAGLERNLHRRRWVAPKVRRFPPTQIHRLRGHRKRPTWTLVYVGTTVRQWGFWTPVGWLEWSLYARMFGASR